MDKDNIHIDSEFVDHSWQEMSKLLDREMPIKKQRKKRLLWIWLMGLGLLGLIGIAYYSQNGSQPPLKSFKVPQNSPVVKLNHSQNNASQSSITPNKASKKQKTTKSSDYINLVSTNKKVSKTHPTAVKEPTVVGVGTPMEKESASTPIRQKIDAKEKYLQSTQIQRSNRQAKVLSPITNLSPNQLKLKEIEFLTLAIPTPNLKQNRWRSGLYAGGLAPKIRSFNFGFQTNYHFHKKWSLHLGLGYSKRITSSTNSNTENQDAAGAIQLAAETEDMSTTSGSNTGPAPAPNGTPNEVELVPSNDFKYTNFHYLELPILLQYNIHKKLSIELGGSIGYLYGFQYQNNGASFFTKDNIPNSNAFDNRTMDLNQNDIGIVRKFNLALIGGINYQFTKNITGYTNYRISNNYLNNSNIATNDLSSPRKWKQIEVGIRYYFK